MERTVYKKLLEWKRAEKRKPLVLEGVRQVGKTWLLKEFGKKEFKNTVYVNCDNNPLLEGLFSDYDIDRIIRFLSAAYDVKIEPKETLIIFDEIQEIPKAIASLKYFNENSEYYVAAAGSLLGLAVHEGTGFPVGNVDIIKLYPLSFEEFLSALGKSELIQMMHAGKWQEVCALSSMIIELLRQYYYVGGMPEAVQKYVATGDIQEVRTIQNNILSSYKLDISKHAPKNDVPKINMVWDSLPAQLSKENKKFIYGAIKKGGRAKEFENAINWLLSAGLVYKIARVNKLNKPLKFYEDMNAFKLYVCDLGLFGAMAGASAKDILVRNNVFSEYKGSFTEQYFVQEFIATKDLMPYYYNNENSTLEIDFVYEDEYVCLCEIKAEENLRSKSMKTVLQSNEDAKGYRFSMAAYKEQERLINIPLYLVSSWLET